MAVKPMVWAFFQWCYIEISSKGVPFGPFGQVSKNMRITLVCDTNDDIGVAMALKDVVKKAGYRAVSVTLKGDIESGKSTDYSSSDSSEARSSGSQPTAGGKRPEDDQLIQPGDTGGKGRRGPGGAKPRRKGRGRLGPAS